MNTSTRFAVVGLSAAVLCLGTVASPASDFSWTGQAGTNGWYDKKHIAGSDPTAYISNWGTVGNPPVFPGALDDVTVVTGPAVLSYQTADIRSLTIGLGATVNAHNGSTLTVNGSGIVGPAINNDGTLLLQHGGYAGHGVLQISNSVEIAGQGQLRFDGGYINGGGTLTNAAEHTIAAGAGDFNASLVNNGLLDVLYSNATLGLKTGTKTNNATMQASGGCTLNIHTTVNQSGTGQLIANGGTVGLISGSITGGTTASTGAGKFWMSHNSGTITDITNTGLWQIQDGSTLTVGGTSLVNDGTFQIGLYSGGYGPSTAQFDEGTILDGSGAFDLSGAYINNSPGATHFTQAAGHTIKGGNSTINAGMTNNGTINADHSNWTLSLKTNAKTNNALMKASNGGYLDVYCPIDQTGSGQILAEAGSNVRLYTGSAITGGTTATTGNGQFALSGGGVNTTLTDLTNTGSWLVENGSVANAAGSTFTNHGTFTVGGYTGGSGLGHFRLASDVELNGTGTLTLWPGHIDSPDGFTLTQAAGHTIHGNGYIDAAVTNHGTIIADRSNQTLELRSAAKTNHAMMKATNGGFLDLRSPINQSASGQIFAEAGSKVRLFTGSAITGGTTATNGNGQFALSGGGVNTTLTDITNTGSWLVENGSVANAAGSTFTNHGTFTVGGYTGGSGWGTFRLNNALQLSGTGTLKLSPGAIDGLATYPLTNGLGHTISGYGRIYASAVLNNLGTIEARGGTLEVYALPSQFAGNTLTDGTWKAVNATLNVHGADPITTNLASVVLDGTASVFAPINTLAENQGSFSLLGSRDFTTVADLVNTGSIHLGPGSKLTVNGAYTQASTLAIDIAGYGNANHGWLAIAGAGSLAGVLDVELAGSFIPSPGDLFTVLTCAGGADGFTLVLAPENQRMWNMTWPDPFTMQLEYVPEPASLILLTLGGLLLRRRGHR